MKGTNMDNNDNLEFRQLQNIAKYAILFKSSRDTLIDMTTRVLTNTGKDFRIKDNHLFDVDRVRFREDIDAVLIDAVVYDIDDESNDWVDGIVIPCDYFNMRPEDLWACDKDLVTLVSVERGERPSRKQKSTPKAKVLN